MFDVTAFIELSLMDKDCIAPDIWVEIALSEASCEDILLMADTMLCDNAFIELSLLINLANVCIILVDKVFIELSLLDKDWIAPDICVDMALSDTS